MRKAEEKIYECQHCNEKMILEEKQYTLSAFRGRCPGCNKICAIYGCLDRVAPKSRFCKEHGKPVKK
jgi:hypothetical protein